MAIDNQYVQFPIIKANRRRGTYIVLAIIVFIGSYGLGLAIGFEDYFLEGLIAISMIVFSIAGLKMKQFDNVGRVVLYPDSVDIETSGKNQTFLTTEMVSISFKLKGIEGLVPEGGIMVSNGMGNIIEVNNKEAAVKEQVFVSNELKINILKRLFEYYEGLGIKVEFEEE